MARKRANGEGTIRKRDNGVWEGRFYVKGEQRSVYGKSQTVVRKKMTEILSEIDNDEFLLESNDTLEEWLNFWQETYLDDVKKSSSDRYKSCIRLHIIPALGKVGIADLRSSTIQRFLNNCKNQKDLSKKSVQNIRLVLSKALDKAVDDERIKKNPCLKTKVPSYDEPPKEMRPLEGNEIINFLKEIENSDYRNILYIALFTGMRESELIGLSWDCIDFTKGTIHLYRQLKRDRGGNNCYAFSSLKNKQSRTFSVPPDVLETLKKVKVQQAKWKLAAGSSWENKNELVFTNELGEHIHTKTLYRRLKKVAVAIGLPDLRFHDLRHPDVKQATKNNEHFIRISKSQENRYTIADTLSSVSISESILEGGFDFYPVIMKNMNFADSALR